MATLYITELTHLGYDGFSAPVMAPDVKTLVTEQFVTITGSSNLSAAFSTTTRFIMVNTDVACCLAFGLNPTALNTQHRMGANETRFYTVPSGYKLAVVVGV